MTIPGYESLLKIKTIKNYGCTLAVKNLLVQNILRKLDIHVYDYCITKIPTPELQDFSTSAFMLSTPTFVLANVK